MQPISSAFQKLVVRRMSVHLERGDSPAVTLTEIRKMINNQMLADTTRIAGYSGEQFIVASKESTFTKSDQLISGKTAGV